MFCFQITNQLKNASFVKWLRSKINDYKTYPSSEYGNNFNINDHGTTHLSVYAPNGDAVAYTSTINLL